MVLRVVHVYVEGVYKHVCVHLSVSVHVCSSVCVCVCTCERSDVTQCVGVEGFDEHKPP